MAYFAPPLGPPLTRWYIFQQRLELSSSPYARL
jgi:hypothetical protein